jgi:hypothetical protein
MRLYYNFNYQGPKFGFFLKLMQLSQSIPVIGY